MPHKHRSETIFTDVALCPPAVRMMVLAAWAVDVEDDDPETHTEAVPVVALRTALAHQFHTTDPDLIVYPHPSQMALAGWEFDVSYPDDDALICDGPSGLLMTATQAYETRGTAFRIVACPWPAEDDARRFAAIYRALQEDLRIFAKFASPE